MTLYPGTLRPLVVIAAWLHRNPETVRTWYRNGELEPRACMVRPRRQLLFDMTDAASIDARSARYANTPRRSLS